MDNQTIDNTIRNLHPKVAEAQDFCMEAHAEELRVITGEPVVEHPFGMARKGYSLGHRKKDLFISFYVHDIAEPVGQKERKYTHKDIEQRFGETISTISSELDKVGKTFDEYRNGIFRSIHLETPIVKAYDLWNNALDLSQSVKIDLYKGTRLMVILKLFGFNLIKKFEPALLDETKEKYDVALSWLRDNEDIYTGKGASWWAEERYAILFDDKDT